MADLVDPPAGLRRSPLAHLAEEMHARTVTGPRGVVLTERPFVAMISVRVDPGTSAARALESVLGVELPRRSGEVTGGEPVAVLWLGPDEWLVVAQPDALDLARRLEAAVHEAHASVVDVSANRAVLELSGPSARAVLEKGCPTDLHATRFTPGTAVTTTLARIPLLLWQVGPETYRLLPRSSFSDYVARWLLDAMVEFETTGVP